MDNKIICTLYKGMLTVALPLAMAACGKNDEPKPAPVPETYDRVTVIYAVNRSSLAGDFTEDCAEMTTAMTKVDLNKNRLLLYRTDSESMTGLYTMTKEGDTYRWTRLKSYDRTTTSTHPDRMAEVLRDAVDAYPAESRTLFFWGHGSAWTPEGSDHEVGARTKADAPVCYGYGGEYGKNGKTNWTDIDELANAIPDGAFDTIWFDCCYMASIEVAYELRDKTRWYVAYPTEVWDKGMNYDAILPLTMQATPNLKLAASMFFVGYNDYKDPVTVTVMDMSKIEPVADAVGAFYKACPDAAQNVSGVVNYRRQRGTPYYDMMQLLRRRAGDRTTPELQAVTDALDQFVVMHLESTVDFNNNSWVNPILCGLSLHNFTNQDTSEDRYYKTLSWYKSVTR